MRAMNRHFGALSLAISLSIGCTDHVPGDQGPFAALPVARTLDAPGLTADVHIARDRFGIAHIYAQEIGDLGYAQGYVMAHDRLPQMDLLRRFGAGTLSDIFGAVVTDIISGDLEMRMHRMRPIALEAYAELLRSDDPTDAKILRLLDRFADGVNAYADDLRNRVYSLDFAISSMKPEAFEPWSPIDSLVLGRFQAFSLSFEAPAEIGLTDLFERASDVFDAASSDPALAARAGAAADFMPLRPVGLVATIDGFPNLGVDTGSRSNGKTRRAVRPRVPPDLLRSALATFATGARPEPQRLGRPLAGSNAWAVGPTLAGGKGLLAGDQHLELASPSVFYPTHLIVPGEVDVEGITFPGIP